MHKLKNKKLLSIFMAGMISYACISIDNIYANENFNKVEIDSSVEDTNDTTDEDNNNIEEDSNANTDVDNSENKDENNSEVELKEILVNEINNSENIGLNIKTQGNIINIQDNKIYIKDESGEGIVYLENISVNNLNIGDCISVIGMVNQIDNENLVIVNDINNIDLVITEENPTEDENEDKDDSNKNESSKPNKLSNSQSISKPSSKGSSSKSNIEEVTVNSIKGKDAIVIESDLTSAQWEKIKSNLEEGNIKVKDLKNNKIRITQVNNECGDNIWIVNDPRKLDSEEIKTIGTEIIHTLLYSEYNVSERRWNTIVDDVESGSAKVKYDSDKNIKVIYQKGGRKDYIITLNRIETKE